jgi:hypothetical protein
MDASTRECVLLDRPDRSCSLAEKLHVHADQATEDASATYQFRACQGLRKDIDEIWDGVYCIEEVAADDAKVKAWFVSALSARFSK